jgi:hypothetical protein
MALNINISNKFRNTFEKRCFRLIIEAYKISLTERIIQLDWNENDISSELHQHIKESSLRKKWEISTNVESHVPKDIPKVKGFSAKFPRIDFRLTSFISTYEFEYFFEAKNLKQNDPALKRRYINTGINNFISGKYVNGSLIGYLLEGKTDETVIGINSLLEKNKRQNEILNFTFNKLFNSYYESFHSDRMILKHLIFDFTAISN